MLDAYVQAELAVLSGQEYTIGARTLRRADLTKIQQGRAFWSNEVSRLERGGGGIIIQFPDQA